MSSFEINKIVGAIFSVTLLIIIINNISNILYNNKGKAALTEVSAIKTNKHAEETIEKEIINNINEIIINANDKSGEKIIKKCIACHSFEENGKNKLGPKLFNVFERKIASVEGFKYSTALKEINNIWNIESLNNFIANPKKWAPGTKMSFIGIKDIKDRANLIKYLMSLK